MSDGERFTFPIERSALTPERRAALKKFVVRRARAERSRTIHDMMTWCRARLRGFRRRPEFHVAPARQSKQQCAGVGYEAIARIPSSCSRIERT